MIWSSQLQVNVKEGLRSVHQTTRPTSQQQPTNMAPVLSSFQYDLIYNCASLGLAGMGASTAFFFLRVGSMHEKYKTALCITGLVTFIAM